jgi:hypothetical protein
MTVASERQPGFPAREQFAANENFTDSSTGLKLSNKISARHAPESKESDGW